MGAFDGLKTLWADPKKKPLVIAGIAVAGTAGFMAMTKPTDEGEAAAEDQVVEGEAPLDTGPFGGLGDTGAGYLPPVLVGGGMGGGDGGMGETDFSGIYDELDRISEEQQADLARQLAAERAARQRGIKKGARRDTAQDKRAREQAKKIKRLQRRGKTRGKAKMKPRRRPPRRRPDPRGPKVPRASRSQRVQAMKSRH